MQTLTTIGGTGSGLFNHTLVDAASATTPRAEGVSDSALMSEDDIVYARGCFVNFDTPNQSRYVHCTLRKTNTHGSLKLCFSSMWFPDYDRILAETIELDRGGRGRGHKTAYLVLYTPRLASYANHDGSSSFVGRALVLRRSLRPGRLVVDMRAHDDALAEDAAKT